jgi:hypothetical protein
MGKQSEEEEEEEEGEEGLRRGYAMGIQSEEEEENDRKTSETFEGSIDDGIIDSPTLLKVGNCLAMSRVRYHHGQHHHHGQHVGRRHRFPMRTPSSTGRVFVDCTALIYS